MTALPTGWSTATLGDFMVARAGSVDPKKFPDEEFDLYSIPAHDRGGGGFDVVRGADIGSSKKVVTPGDVMVSKIVPHIRRTRVVGPIGGHRQISSTEWITFRSSVHDPKFLKHFLVSDEFHTQFMATVSGVGGSLMRAQPASVKAIKVPVPPLDEQRRIVEILEDHLSRLDAGLAQLATAEALLGVMIDSAIGAAPELADAHLKPLGDVLGAPLGNGKSVPTADEGFPVLRLTAMRDGVIDLRERKIGNWRADDAASFLVARGDVFAARGNGSLKLVGRAARVVDDPDPVAYPDTMIRMRPNPDVLRADFLTAVWNSRTVRRQIEQQARTTAGIYKVNQKDLRGMLIPVPDLDAQASFVDRIDDFAYTVRGTERAVTNARRRTEALSRSLLAAAFSGRLTGSSSDLDRVEELAEVGA